MSDRIEQFTDIILACLSGAPNARAGARLTAYRLVDETRKALKAQIAKEQFAAELTNVLTKTPAAYRASMLEHILNVALDATFRDDPMEDAA